MAKDKGQPLNRREFLSKTAAAGVTAAALTPGEVAAQTERRWDYEADFVSIGAGVSGLAAGVSALEHGASVILVDENHDIGGHGMISGGLVHLGGGHSYQRMHGVEDSTEQVYEDWIRPDHPLARYNDRDLVRVFAEENASTFEWLVDNGVDFFDEQIFGPQMASTIPRQVRTRQWPNKDELYTARPSRRGSGLVRALEKKILEKVRASGLMNIDWSNLILVTQDGVRFWDETANDYDFLAAALESRGQPDKRNGGGPIWAIFDHAAVERQGWDPTPPNVDPNGFFFSADSISELAQRIENEHQPYPMPAEMLEETVARFNGFVDAGVDKDFGKPQPMRKMETPPFYAAWSTPTIHDSYAGLRINTSAQVMDLHGEIIEGLYAAGECHGGFNQHGLGRSLVFGRIAGRHAAES